MKFRLRSSRAILMATRFLKRRAVSAKGGLMMGTKKVGAFSSPLKKAIFIMALGKQK
jgi:hypothetical protein